MHMTVYIYSIVVKIEDFHTRVWDLSPEQRKQLILSAVIGSYSDALDNMKQSLKDYNKTLESYEVIMYMHIKPNCLQMHFYFVLNSGRGKQRD